MTERVTAIILNFRRDKNLPEIVKAIREQTVPTEVWVWHNSFLDDGIRCGDVTFQSSRNLCCHPRIILSGMVRTPFIWWNDDDRKIADPDLFKKLIEEMKGTGADVLGINGKDFVETVDWSKPYQGSGWAAPGRSLFVNTGFSFFDRRAICKIPTNLYALGYTEDELRFGDDMIISKYMDSVFVSKHIEGANVNISEQGIGLSHETKHMDIRNSLCRMFWMPKGES